MDKCCIVFVTHKSKLDGDEELSLKQCIKVFGKKRTIIIVIPDNISTEYYDQYKEKIKICKVNSKWQSSYKEYNAMCVNKEFYKMFTDYDYILIYQSDCWVFDDKLDYFMSLGYDWYGAPWTKSDCITWKIAKETSVGNGGLSMRKVSKMIEITTKYDNNGNTIPSGEDIWFCITHKNEINICDLKSACNFSFEAASKEILQNIDDIPMGIHGKFNSIYWDDNGNSFLNLKSKINEFKEN
jgi:hypothetical protein